MKKNLLTVLVLALTLVNTILIGVMMVSVMGTNKKTAKLVGDIATVLNLELGTAGEEEKPEVSLADTEVYAIDGSMTILLKSEPGATKSTYIVFDIALSLNKKHADYKKYGGENFKSYDSMIKSAINDAVMQYTELECRNDMKDDILKAIQEIFQSDFVYNISLSGVKFG